MADIDLVEGRLQQQHGLLELGSQHRQVVALLVDAQCLEQQLAGSLLVGGGRFAERVVDAEFTQRRLDVDEFVAGAHQQRVRHVARADAQRVLAVLTQLGDERAKVAVAGDDDKGVDLVALDGDLERVERHADVGAILAGAHAEDLQEVDRVVHQVLAVAGEATPVTVRSHDGNGAALLEIGHQRGQLEVEKFLLRP